ncbi:MAG: hypothetical protein H9806_00315 [Candidatus Lactobacillus pullistercoris]|uniref:Uncharacterized protein n=1 Tax=Candidatus Lactobacillus pullistercoris TaxID=2838636 RepID=A0A9E2KQU2_9LACO|nr:hypothetical protein [Candidatus Lactobacillus pullistercoris]
MSDKEKLEQMKSNLQKIAAQNPQKEVSYQEIFSNSFMQKYTQFANFIFFMKGLKIDDFSKIEKLKSDTLNDFVQKNSHFKTWEEMQQAAVNDYMNSLF